MHRFFDFITKALIIASIITLSYGYYLALLPVHIITYNQTLITPAKEEYNAGEQLFTYIDFCKNGDYNAVVYPELVGESIVPMEPFTSQVAPGCYATNVAVGFIPLHTPAGDYKLRLITKYRVNAFKVITYTIDSNAFTVLSGKLIYL